MRRSARMARLAQLARLARLARLAQLPLLPLDHQHRLRSHPHHRPRSHHHRPRSDHRRSFVAPIGQTDPMAAFDLQRFVDAQDEDGTFDRAMVELDRGAKRSHWMWFVFPQIAGLGTTNTARYFALASVEEAAAYLLHPVLAHRLYEASERVLAIDGSSAFDIFGGTDAAKLCSSMTIFLRADPDEPLFGDMLDQYFDGVPDGVTDQLIANSRQRRSAMHLTRPA